MRFRSAFEAALEEDNLLEKADPDSPIRESISVSLRRLLDVRKALGSWNDKGESGTGIIKTMEALESFLTPICALEDITLAPDGFTSVLTNDLTATLDFLSKEGWVPEPYLFHKLEQVCSEQGIPFERQDSWCVDSASFAVTTCLDARQYFDLRARFLSKDRTVNPAESELMKRLGVVALQGVSWLAQNAISSSGRTRWTWGARAAGRPSLYFTYSASVALSSFVGAVSKPSRSMAELSEAQQTSLIEATKRCLQGAVQWVVDSVQPSDQYGMHVFVDRALKNTEDPYDEKAFLGWALEILEAAAVVPNIEIVDVTVKICRSLTYMFKTKEYAELFQQPYNHLVSLRDQRVPYVDRTLVFLTLRGLSWAYLYLRDRSFEGKETLLPEMSEMIADLYQDIQDDRAPETGLWSYSRFEIYRTQRSIEALTYLAKYYGDENLPRVESELESLRRSLMDVFSSDDVLRYLVDRIVERKERISRLGRQ